MKRSGGFKLFSFVTGLLMFSAMFVPVSISQNPVNEATGTPPGWSEDINLSNNPKKDAICAIASQMEDIFVVWRHTYIPSGNYQVVYSKSIDSGRTWKPFGDVSDSDLLANNPDISASGDNVHVVWDDTKDTWESIYYRSSSDGGETWNDEKRISRLDSWRSLGPQIFVNESNVHIIWLDLRDNDQEIYYRRSLDGGITFDNGQGVDEDRRLTFITPEVSYIRMGGYESNISVVWCDESDGDWELYWMISKDNGNSWEDGLGSPNVGRKISNSIHSSVEPSIAIDGINIHIVWFEEEWPGPNYTIYYRNSTDNGVTWNPIQLLSGPNSASFAPDIAVSGDNIWVMWNDNRNGSHEVFFKNSTDGGMSWGLDTRLTEMDGFTSGAPVIELIDTIVHVVWEDERTGDWELFYKRSPDFPETNPPNHTNEIPPQDSYRDAPGTNISVHVTDPSGVNESTIQLWVNGSLVTHVSTQITDGFNVSYISPGFAPGVVTCRIVADDNCSNTLNYTWNFTVLALYEIQLHEGWNLISVPHVQVDTAINEVLRDIDGKWNYIQWYDPTDTDHWKSYATFKPAGLNDLFEINRTMAIWINITEPNVNLTIRGHLSTHTEIQLYAGWNLVGFPTQNTETVANSLWGTGADRVEVFNATAPYRIKEVVPTYLMKPGEGYWIHVPADTTWIIDW